MSDYDIEPGTRLIDEDCGCLFVAEVDDEGDIRVRRTEAGESSYCAARWPYYGHLSDAYSWDELATVEEADR